MSSDSLPARQEELARRIHSEAIVVLAHDHIPPRCDYQDLDAGGITAKFLLANVDVLVWASDPEEYRDSIERIEGFHATALKIYEDVHRQFQEYPKLLPVLRSQDILRAKQQGRIGILMGSEGGKLVEYSLDNLRRLYVMGLRHIMPCWAYNNQLTTSELDTGIGGLTELGRETITEMNRLGMVVDITHLSRPAMKDVLETSTRPILNSHSALKSISHRLPAMTEEEIRGLADKGGVFALHFMTHMLTGRFSPPASMDEVMRQIDAIVKIGGIDCLALGPDYLPYTEEFKRNTNQWELSFPVGLETSAGMLNLTRALVSAGYAEDGIHKILGGNLMRLLRETID